jgi:hypothetical protein
MKVPSFSVVEVRLFRPGFDGRVVTTVLPP